MEKIKIKSSFIKDFKEFISKGNVLDMAVGVIIGGKFGAIVTSLVNDIITPLIGLITGNDGDLTSLKTVITPAKEGVEEVAVKWGIFLQSIIDFLLVALCIFIVLRIIMKMKNRLHAKELEEQKAKDEEAKAAADAAAAAAEARKQELENSMLEQAKLLSEIRDLMKSGK